jgi:hypothetical protein
VIKSNNAEWLETGHAIGGNHTGYIHVLGTCWEPIGTYSLREYPFTPWCMDDSVKYLNGFILFLFSYGVLYLHFGSTSLTADWWHSLVPVQYLHPVRYIRTDEMINLAAE